MYLYYTLSSTGGDSGSTAAWVDNRVERYRTYSENGRRACHASNLIYLPNSYYADPIFSWLQPIGVTSMRLYGADH